MALENDPLTLTPFSQELTPFFRNGFYHTLKASYTPFNEEEIAFLNSAADTMVRFNPSHSLPYHNSSHALNVATSLVYALIATYPNHFDLYGELGVARGKISAAGWEFFRFLSINLVLAALFHDFNHSGEGDSVQPNINRAIEGLNKYVGYFPFAELFIYSTYYPYEPASFLLAKQPSYHWPYTYAKLKEAIEVLLPEGTQEQKNILHTMIGFIRDADRATWLCRNWTEIWVFNGLALELGSRSGDYGDERIKETQLDFMFKSIWYTKWAQNSFSEHSSTIEAEFDRVIAKRDRTSWKQFQHLPTKG